MFVFKSLIKSMKRVKYTLKIEWPIEKFSSVFNSLVAFVIVQLLIMEQLALKRTVNFTVRLNIAIYKDTVH